MSDVTIVREGWVQKREIKHSGQSFSAFSRKLRGASVPVGTHLIQVARRRRQLLGDQTGLSQRSHNGYRCPLSRHRTWLSVSGQGLETALGSVSSELLAPEPRAVVYQPRQNQSPIPPSLPAAAPHCSHNTSQAGCAQRDVERWCGACVIVVRSSRAAVSGRARSPRAFDVRGKRVMPPLLLFTPRGPGESRHGRASPTRCEPPTKVSVQMCPRVSPHCWRDGGIFRPSAGPRVAGMDLPPGVLIAHRALPRPGVSLTQMRGL
ncbi:hypothetical protein COCON_G00039600 [Conger conger]|uniref:Uncharacterized protein n=1 Tax=Conger conger TaxID=82655 RepID=A0A9Q1E0C8_CONCO|nr:hypothetical protein COCON_G00039600 [Conger conger]